LKYDFQVGREKKKKEKEELRNKKLIDANYVVDHLNVIIRFRGCRVPFFRGGEWVDVFIVGIEIGQHTFLPFAIINESGIVDIHLSFIFGRISVPVIRRDAIV
jgi:hypothetical protein